MPPRCWKPLCRVRSPLPPSSPPPSTLRLGYFPEGMPLAYLIATVVTGLGLLIGASSICPVRTSGSTIGFSPLSPLSGRQNHRHGRLQVGYKGIRD